MAFLTPEYDLVFTSYTTTTIQTTFPDPVRFWPRQPIPVEFCPLLTTSVACAVVKDKFIIEGFGLAPNSDGDGGALAVPE